MSHQDEDRCRARCNAEHLKQALHWLLRDIQWSGIGFRADCTWTPVQLVANQPCHVGLVGREPTLGERLFAGEAAW
ncbi:MAG: hypothetical protein R3C99_20880 [Pirellulaceae bacterium]